MEFLLRGAKAFYVANLDRREEAGTGDAGIVWMELESGPLG